jgi:hypothetical protein
LGRGCEELGLGNACSLDLGCQEFVVGRCNKGREGGIESRRLDRDLRVLTSVRADVLIDGVIAEGMGKAIGIEKGGVLLYDGGYERIVETTECVDEGCDNFIRYGGTVVLDIDLIASHIEQKLFQNWVVICYLDLDICEVVVYALIGRKSVLLLEVIGDDLCGSGVGDVDLSEGVVVIVTGIIEVDGIVAGIDEGIVEVRIAVDEVIEDRGCIELGGEFLQEGVNRIRTFTNLYCKIEGGSGGRRGEDIGI